MPDSNPEVFDKIYVHKTEIAPICSRLCHLANKKVTSAIEVFPGTGSFSYDMALRGISMTTIFNNVSCVNHLRKLIKVEDPEDKLEINILENSFPNYKVDMIYCVNYELLTKYILGKDNLKAFFEKIEKHLKNNGSFILNFGPIKDAYQLFSKKKYEKSEINDGRKYKLVVSPQSIDYVNQIITCNYFITVSKKYGNSDVIKPVSKNIQRSLFTIRDLFDTGIELGFECSVSSNGYDKITSEDISKTSPYLVFRKSRTTQP